MAVTERDERRLRDALADGHLGGEADAARAAWPVVAAAHAARAPRRRR
ncbi:MAG: hypothetical protein JWN65_2568, partial [Solirubrobacterales bacterium]|nr:hypothetical protein [Solirubrobacterales bacterium]